MTFGLVRFCRGSNSEKSETELLNRLEYFNNNLMLKRSSPRNCKMIFIIGRGFAESRISKK